MWIWSTNILSSISIVKLFGLPFRLSNFLLGFFVFQYRYMIFATWSGLCVCVYVCGVLENAQHTLTQVKRKINFHCYWCHSNDQYSRSNSNKHFSSFSFPSPPNVSVYIVVLRRCCWFCPHPPNHTLICDSICITQLNKYTTNIRIHTHTHLLVPFAMPIVNPLKAVCSHFRAATTGKISVLLWFELWMGLSSTHSLSYIVFLPPSLAWSTLINIFRY